MTGSPGALWDFERRVRRRFGGGGKWTEATLISAYVDIPDQRLRAGRFAPGAARRVNFYN